MYDVLIMERNVNPMRALAYQLAKYLIMLQEQMALIIHVLAGRVSCHTSQHVRSPLAMRRLD